MFIIIALVIGIPVLIGVIASVATVSSVAGFLDEPDEE